MNIIEISKLYKRINNLELRIEDFYLGQGETLALVGDKNSGKEILFNILLNLYTYKEGEIKIFGEDYLMNIGDIKGRIAAIPQSNWLIEGKNVNQFLASTRSRYENIDRARVKDLKNEFMLRTNKKVLNLSPLDRRKLAIISALMTNAPILLVGEPMTISDEHIREKLYEQIRLSNRSTIIFSENLLDAKKICQRIYYLKDGLIVHEENMDDKESTDKVLIFKSDSVDLQEFEDIGAISLDTNDASKKLYYTGYMPELTRVVYAKGIKDYIIRDSNLEEKLDYLERTKDLA